MHRIVKLITFRSLPVLNRSPFLFQYARFVLPQIALVTQPLYR